MALNVILVRMVGGRESQVPRALQDAQHGGHVRLHQHPQRHLPQNSGSRQIRRPAHHLRCGYHRPIPAAFLRHLQRQFQVNFLLLLLLLLTKLNKPRIIPSCPFRELKEDAPAPSVWCCISSPTVATSLIVVSVKDLANSSKLLSKSAFIIIIIITIIIVVIIPRRRS